MLKALFKSLTRSKWRDNLRKQVDDLIANEKAVDEAWAGYNRALGKIEAYREVLKATDPSELLPERRKAFLQRIDELSEIAKIEAKKLAGVYEQEVKQGIELRAKPTR